MKPHRIAELENTQQCVSDDAPQRQNFFGVTKDFIWVDVDWYGCHWRFGGREMADQNGQEIIECDNEEYRRMSVN